MSDHRQRVDEAAQRALREAANAWTQGQWADVLLPKPESPAVPVIAYANRVGDWLRAQADAAEEGDRRGCVPGSLGRDPMTRKWKVGDPDPTPPDSPRLCLAENNRLMCTLPAGHDGDHVAGDGESIVAVWSSADDPMNVDLSSVSTADLVDEARRRAPTCPSCGVPMLHLGLGWYTCPQDGATEDYAVTDARAGRSTDVTR